MPQITREYLRLDESKKENSIGRSGTLPERTAMGNGRGDYSGNGDAWNYFTHDMARSCTYR
jgi:hypothetical protein